MTNNPKLVDDPDATVEEILGRRVKAMRQIKGWTQAELADQLAAQGLSFSQATIAKLEGAKRPTTVAELSTLAKVFDQDPSDLLIDYELPEGLPEYAADERAERAAKKQLDRAVSEYLWAQDALSRSAQRLIEGSDLVDPQYIARSLAESPEYIVRQARHRWESINQALDDRQDEWTLDGQDISEEATKALRKFGESPKEQRDLVALFRSLNGVDPEAS